MLCFSSDMREKSNRHHNSLADCLESYTRDLLCAIKLVTNQGRFLFLVNYNYLLRCNFLVAFCFKKMFYRIFYFISIALIDAWSKNLIIRIDCQLVSSHQTLMLGNLIVLCATTFLKFSALFRTIINMPKEECVWD